MHLIIASFLSMRHLRGKVVLIDPKYFGQNKEEEIVIMATNVRQIARLACGFRPDKDLQFTATKMRTKRPGFF